ncbi:hypothetical protein [Nocardiopsis baichengensis]|uniref:hypothetical protein n=1 Tax=Nocardiopsis baichengensis TaxID=280240 RepID=UPI0012689F5D|nr:hypothetical protein [Nocardiopsis baichengensis]
MRARAWERENLHGWPTDAEVLAADFPDWEISRDLADDPGEWRAVRGDCVLSAPTVPELRALLEAAEEQK